MVMQIALPWAKEDQASYFWYLEILTRVSENPLLNQCKQFNSSSVSFESWNVLGTLL